MPRGRGGDRGRASTAQRVSAAGAGAAGAPCGSAWSRRGSAARRAAGGHLPVVRRGRGDRPGGAHGRRRRGDRGGGGSSPRRVAVSSGGGVATGGGVTSTTGGWVGAVVLGESGGEGERGGRKKQAGSAAMHGKFLFHHAGTMISEANRARRRNENASDRGDSRRTEAAGSAPPHCFTLPLAAGSTGLRTESKKLSPLPIFSLRPGRRRFGGGGDIASNRRRRNILDIAEHAVGAGRAGDGAVELGARGASIPPRTRTTECRDPESCQSDRRTSDLGRGQRRPLLRRDEERPKAGMAAAFPRRIHLPADRVGQSRPLGCDLRFPASWSTAPIAASTRAWNMAGSLRLGVARIGQCRRKASGHVAALGRLLGTASRKQQKGSSLCIPFLGPHGFTSPRESRRQGAEGNRRGGFRIRKRLGGFDTGRPRPISRASPQPFGTGRAVAQRVQRIDRLRFHRR